MSIQPGMNRERARGGIVKRLNVWLKPDSSTVLIQPLRLGGKHRYLRVMARIMALGEDEVVSILTHVLDSFSERHHQIRDTFRRRYEELKDLALTDRVLSEERQLLIGAYFSQEYSLQSTALFNPSIVPHPDQKGLDEGALRFVVSLRAIGEGHVSSILFRTGIVDAAGSVTIHRHTRLASAPRQITNRLYDKPLFERKLLEADLANDLTRRVMGMLGDSFTIDELQKALDTVLKQARLTRRDFTARGIMLLAESNYDVQFSPDQLLSERAIFPSSPTQINGIEDARFVLFQDDNADVTYYATYTAYDGKLILPQLLETSDFLHFKFITLNGPGVQNKGMALFPRKINGHYAMLSRQDNENIFLMYSDNIHFWSEAKVIARPTFPWQFVQIGNCGSPIETDEGWLVLTHGVGPIRQYFIGALLLDRDDPTKLLARLTEPLIAPTPEEREGYVPNVVYTCGALLHNGRLIIPYAAADYATSFSTIGLEELLAAMKRQPI